MNLKYKTNTKAAVTYHTCTCNAVLAQYTVVTNVKCKLLCVRFYILIFVFSGFVCWNGYS